jgi:hypothetical protein
MADIESKTWQSAIAVGADPEHVLDTLTDIDACEAWSPVGFQVDGLDSARLTAGSTTNVSGRLGGCRVRFHVEVFRADCERLVLRATGPVEMQVRYVVRRSSRGSRVDAAISVQRGRGRAAAIAASVTRVLLGAGALDEALGRIAREAERRHDRARSRSFRSGPTGGRGNRRSRASLATVTS